MKNINCHPPREDVSWNDARNTNVSHSFRHPPREDVSWNVYAAFMLSSPPVILLVRRWVEILEQLNHISAAALSSSLWGCELKYLSKVWYCLTHCHPPCEDVSWNISLLLLAMTICCHPPCEDVSWNIPCVVFGKSAECHPPRGDVSWNNWHGNNFIQTYVILLVRMWGAITISHSDSMSGEILASFLSESRRLQLL